MIRASEVCNCCGDVTALYLLYQCKECGHKVCGYCYLPNQRACAKCKPIEGKTQKSDIVAIAFEKLYAKRK